MLTSLNTIQSNSQRTGYSDRQAKSCKTLDPSVKPIVPELAEVDERNADWKLIINVRVNLDQ